MRTEVVRVFEFDPVSECFCGRGLDPAAERFEKKFSRGTIRIVRCLNCGSWIQAPRLTTAALTEWYDSEEYKSAQGAREGAYLNYMEDEAQRRREAVARYRRDLARLLKPKSKLLEIGCATASFLSVLHDAGHDVLGLDLSTEFVAQARRLYPNINVSAGDFMRLEFAAGTFDAIIALGTISNLQDLAASLRRARGLLKPGGLLYFNFPAADSILAWFYGRRYWMFAPSVCSFLSRRGCRLALERAGFEIKREALDRQMPSLSKVLGHSRMKSLYPLAKKMGVDACALPFPVPIPGVRIVLATTPA